MKNNFKTLFEKYSKLIKKYISIFLILSIILPVNATYINVDSMKGDFFINNDSINTTSTGTTLNMNLTGVNQMRFGNTPGERDSAIWETYSSTKSWNITSGIGKKTVYASFKNSSGNTKNIVDDIILKSTPNLPYTTGLTLWLDANDSGSITSSGGDISSWNDKSGNSYHAKQANIANQANLVSNTIDFNGTSDYFYLENLNYTSVSPLDGILVCTVFKTPNTNTSISGNWAFLDFDRSEWFNFYNRGDGIGLSYDAGGIQDIYVSGVGINDDQWHVSCASYDNSLVNDTIITIDGNTEYSNDLEGNGSQIGVGQATRYGFVGEGSEANSQNGSRNNSYYDGAIAEIVYFDTAVSSTDQKDIECYLGEKWDITISGCPDSIKPITSVSYNPEVSTSDNIISTLDNFSEDITITNNGGSPVYTFTSTGSFTYLFQDSTGNTGSTLAEVDWIDPTAPSVVGNSSLNEAPTITSYSGSVSKTLKILSGATDIATISATDSLYNVVGEYGHSSLSGNTWQTINNYEMCAPAVVVSHRQDVSGEIQRAPRVRNKTSTGFQVHVDNYNSTIGGITTQIDYMVMNSGSHDFGGGLLIEAGTQNTTAIACSASSSPIPNTVSFTSPFVFAPSVFHTISTENDSSWVVSGVNGDNGDRGSEPNKTKMGTVLQRSFNSCVHPAEDIDYIAVEKGNYTLIDGTILDTKVSTDTIGSVTTLGDTITFNTAFSNIPLTVLVSQLGEDGGNGGYAQIHTAGGVLKDKVYTTIDEDGPGADRSHTNEVAGMIAFSKNNGQFREDNTITYSITGGNDSSDFNINSSNGELNFNSPKFPTNFLDTNNDGIYEVVISACDSHCNSKCSTQTILADTRDITLPVISSTNFSSGSVLPGGNHDIEFNYSDEVGGSLINTASGNLVLEKWNGTSWINDTNFSQVNINSTQAVYNTNNLVFGKYKATFTISDNAGNISNPEIFIFYIDQPEMIISTGSIDIGNINNLTNTFGNNLTITVKTIGAPFRIKLKKNLTLKNNNSSDTISYYNGTNGFGYDKNNDGNLFDYNNDIIGQEVSNINTDGNLNTYIYTVKMGAIIETMQVGGDYTGKIDFEINLYY